MKKINDHINHSKTDGTRQSQLKSFFSFLTRRKVKNIARLKKINCGVKGYKNEIRKSDKSLRSYIKRNCKWVAFLIVIYTIIFGAIVSAPVAVNHLRTISRNESEQERFITQKLIYTNYIVFRVKTK